MQTGLWKSTLRDLTTDYKDIARHLTIGFTITGKDKLEPGAPSTEERIEALRELHDKYMVKTFVSLEPITSIHTASEVIKKTYQITDEIRIGAQSPIKKIDMILTSFSVSLLRLSSWHATSLAVLW